MKNWIVPIVIAVSIFGFFLFTGKQVETNTTPLKVVEREIVKDTIYTVRYVDKTRILYKHRDSIQYKFKDSTIIFVDTLNYVIPSTDSVEVPTLKEVVDSIIVNMYQDSLTQEFFNLYWTIETTGDLVEYEPVVVVKCPKPTLREVIKNWFKKN